MRSFLAAFILIIVLAVVAVTIWNLPGRMHTMRDHVLWTAAPDERIYCVQSGAADGHILVASERGNKWFLRDVSIRGEIKVVASGSGNLQTVSAVTSPSWQGDAVVVGLGRCGASLPYTAVECDLNKGTVEAIPLRDVTAFNLSQPYSPGGRWLALASSGPIGQPKIFGVWLVDRQTKRPLLILRDSTSVHDITWSADGRLFVYCGQTGVLLAGKPPAVKLLGRMPPGVRGFVMPDGRQILIVQQGNHFIRIVAVDVRSSKRRVLYQGSFGTASKASVIDIQYSDQTRETAVNLVGPDVYPLLIEPGGQTRQVPVSDAMRWRLAAGVTPIKPGIVAVVSKSTEQAADQIVTIPVR